MLYPLSYGRESPEKPSLIDFSPVPRGRKLTHGLTSRKEVNLPHPTAKARTDKPAKPYGPRIPTDRYRHAFAGSFEWPRAGFGIKSGVRG
jgi:hypothetical protein